MPSPAVTPSKNSVWRLTRPIVKPSSVGTPRKDGSDVSRSASIASRPPTPPIRTPARKPALTPAPSVAPGSRRSSRVSRSMAGIMGCEELTHNGSDQVWVRYGATPPGADGARFHPSFRRNRNRPPSCKEVAMLRRRSRLVLFAPLLGLLLVPALLAPAQASGIGLEGVPSFSNVFLIIGENTTYSQLSVGKAPYQESHLRPDAAWFTNYFATSHYSTSNYVAMTSGQYTRCEQEDIKPIDCHQDTANIFNQLTDAGTSWKEWNESMPSPCYLLNAGADKTLNSYRPKHSPAEYYTGVVGDYANPSSLCTDNVIPAGTTGPNDMRAFNRALRDHTASAFNYVVPNMCEDGHDNCTAAGNPITQFDDFLAREVPLIQATYPDALVIVTYDEGQGGGANNGSKFGGGNVLLAMVGPQVVPGTYAELRNHYGLLRTLEDGFGIGTYANNAATADPITGDVWS